MNRILLLLLMLSVTGVRLVGADAPRIASLAELDKAPERLEAPPVVISEELRRAAVDDTVTMTAVVGPEGNVLRVEDVKAANPATAKAATQAVKGWVFTRGFSGGQPVGFRLPVGVAIRPGQTTDESADSAGTVGAFGGSILQIASPTYETIPEYPAALKSAPVDGHAIVNLWVDADGRPSDPVVEYASRPEFAAPAAATVLEWTFAPTVHADKPFASRTTVSVLFPAKSAEWDAQMRVRQAQLAYARSYDEAPQEKGSSPIVFPYEALVSGKRGIATLAVVVSPEGRVVQVSAGPGADPEFVAASRAGLAKWTFFPAQKAGRPVYGLIALNMNFDPHREEFGYDPETFKLIAGLGDGTAVILPLKQVDTMPAPTKQVAPILPADHEGESAGEALIEVIVDTNGRAQLPRVVRATNPGLGWAAATALAQWKFKPARKGGEPVACRARIPVKFTEAKPASEAVPAS